MEFLLSDLSFSNICISPPKLIENNNYSFPLHYRTEKEHPMVFRSTQLYSLRVKDELCELHIKEKNELQFFNELYNYLLNTLYEQHDKWFENKFERERFNTMFKDYLYPNIQENAVNIKCNVDSELINKLNKNDTVDIYPTFKLNSIIFNELEFLIDLQLINGTFLENLKIKENDIEKKENSLEENNELVEENNELVEENNDLVEKNTVLEEKINSLNDLEEVEVKTPINEMEDFDMDLSESDYFIIFKIIQSNIKDNFSNTLVSLLNERNINTKKLDINAIVYDSDEDEDSEDEYLNNDNFEENYKNIV